MKRPLLDTRDTGLMSPMSRLRVWWEQSHSQVLSTRMEVGLQLHGACGGREELVCDACLRGMTNKGDATEEGDSRVI